MEYMACIVAYKLRPLNVIINIKYMACMSIVLKIETSGLSRFSSLSLSLAWPPSTPSYTYYSPSGDPSPQTLYTHTSVWRCARSLDRVSLGDSPHMTMPPGGGGEDSRPAATTSLLIFFLPRVTYSFFVSRLVVESLNVDAPLAFASRVLFLYSDGRVHSRGGRVLE